MPMTLIAANFIIDTHSSIDSFLHVLTNDDKEELKTSQRPEVQKTHREGVRMNTTALRREMHIKKKDITSTKSHDLDDQREAMELESESFESVLTKPLYANNKHKSILNDVEMTKDVVMRFEKIRILLFIIMPIIN